MKNSLLLVLLGLLLACSDKDQAVKPESFLNELNTEHKGIAYHWNQDDFHLGSILMATRGSSEGFVYIMNGDCSFCIGHFVEFLIEMEHQKCRLPIYVIVEDEYTAQVEYHLQQLQKSWARNVKVIGNTKRKYVRKNIDNFDLNGVVFYYKQNQVKKCIMYVGQ